jgi:hypothetical protein
VFGRPNFIEVAFARFKLVDATGCSFVYSHRIYGEKMGDEMSAWLSANGSDIEKALMEWSSTPSPIKSTWLQSAVSRSLKPRRTWRCGGDPRAFCERSEIRDQRSQISENPLRTPRVNIVTLPIA